MTEPHLGPPAATPLTFDVDGQRYTLPALATRTWLSALVLEPPGCWWQLIPARLAADGGDRLYMRIRDPDDPLDLDDLEQIATRVLTAVLGTDFWAATRLAQHAYANWFAFDGWCWTRGAASPLELPISRVLTGVFAWRVGLCEKDAEVTRLQHEIWAGPPATTASGRERRDLPTWATDGREEAAFDDFLSMVGTA